MTRCLDHMVQHPAERNACSTPGQKSGKMRAKAAYLALPNADRAAFGASVPWYARHIARSGEWAKLGKRARDQVQAEVVVLLAQEWCKHLPAETVPRAAQWSLWLGEHHPARVEKAIQVAAAKFTRNAPHGASLDAGDVGRYVSGILRAWRDRGMDSGAGGAVKES